MKVNAQFVGIFIAASPAIKYSSLYIKSLEICKYIYLRKSSGSYEAEPYLLEEIYIDLD